MKNTNGNKSVRMVSKVLDSGRAVIINRGNAIAVVHYYRDANGRKRQQWQVVKK